MLRKIKDLVMKYLKLAWDKANTFLKEWWLHIVNYVVVWLLYGRLWDMEELLDMKGLLILTLGGLYILFLSAYYLFWKIFGLEKSFKKDAEE